jgi:hypothetical protein
MKARTTMKVLGLVMAIMFCYVGISGAQSSSATGAGANASVDLDFQIIIPNFIYFRVGTAGPTVDTVSFAPTAAQVAAGTQDIAGTGGDLTGGAVTVNLISNGGAVTIDANGNGGLSDGSNTIDFATISTVSSDTDLPAPTLSNATSFSSPT